MKIFKYIIKDKKGIHARNIVALVNECKNLNSEIYIKFKDEIVDITNLIKVLNLNIRYQDEIEVRLIGGDNEEFKIVSLEKYFKENV